MAPFDRSYSTAYQSAIETSSFLYSFIIIYCDLEIQVKGHSPCEFMHDLYIAELYRPGCLQQFSSCRVNRHNAHKRTADSLSSFTSTQRSPEKVA